MALFKSFRILALGLALAAGTVYASPVAFHSSPEALNCERLLTGAPAMARVLKRTPFYQFQHGLPLSSSSAIKNEYGEIRHLYYPRILEQYLLRPNLKERFLNWLKSPNAETEMDLPLLLLAKLKALGEGDRNSLISLIESWDGRAGSVSFADFNDDLHEFFLYKLFPDPPPLKKVELDRSQVIATFQDYTDFLGISVAGEKVIRSDGTIDIEELLKTRRINPETTPDSAPFVSYVFSREEPFEINYVIYPEDGHYRIRFGVENRAAFGADPYFGNRHHTFTSQGHDVLFAGKLFLTDDGRVFAMTLRSGHYMANREQQIEWEISTPARPWQRSLTVDEQEKVSRRARALDADLLRKIVTGTFGLKTDAPKLENPFIFYSRSADWQQYERFWGRPIQKPVP
jgi:hypothetical protein